MAHLVPTHYVENRPFAGIAGVRDFADNGFMLAAMQYAQPAHVRLHNSMTLENARTVAVAEDPFIRRYVRALLAKHGFQIVENDTRVTRKLMESGELRPDVLITNEPATFAGFAAALPVLYLAAAPDPGLVARFRSSRMLRKPFQPEQLLQAVNELTATALV